jgi:hypothetical protein
MGAIINAQESGIVLENVRQTRSKEISGIEYESIKELARRTKMPVSWWYGQTRKTGMGSVPRVKKGKYLLFIPAEVDAWLKIQTN